ncbi:MAG: hypothetical protein FWE13_02250 [Firmicutes bacterium]|nr:hypothetical protein [Bacillota bacterium]
MEFVAKTFKYLRSSWWLIWLMCLPASVVLAFFMRPLGLVSFLPTYALSEMTGTGNFLRLHFEPLIVDSRAFIGLFIVMPILIVITLFLTVCSVFSLIEIHFRTGRLQLKRPLSRINEYFIPTAKIFAFIIVFFIIYFALIIGLNALQHNILTGGRDVLEIYITPSVGSIITMAIITLLIFVLVCWLMAPVMFMLPFMQVYGYGFGDGLRNATSYYAKNPFRISFGIAFIFLISIALSTVLAGLEEFLPIAVRIIISIVIQSFTLMYFFAYCMVVSFDVANIERRDKGV